MPLLVLVAFDIFSPLHLTPHVTFRLHNTRGAPRSALHSGMHTPHRCFVSHAAVVLSGKENNHTICSHTLLSLIPLGYASCPPPSNSCSIVLCHFPLVSLCTHLPSSYALRRYPLLLPLHPNHIYCIALYTLYWLSFAAFPIILFVESKLVPTFQLIYQTKCPEKVKIKP